MIDAYTLVPGVAVVEEFLGASFGVGGPEIGEVAGDSLANGVDGGGGVGVGSAIGFGDDFVDDAEGQEIGGGDAHGLGSGSGLTGVVPEDAGTRLGAGHRVDGVFEHEHAVAQADGERAAAAPLTYDGGDDGHVDGEHSHEAGGDGLADAALLGLHTGAGAGSIYEGEDG